MRNGEAADLEVPDGEAGPGLKQWEIGKAVAPGNPRRGLARTGRPATWSLCSWVIRIAVRDWGATPIRSRRSKVSLRLSPASIKRRVRSVASSVAFPVLEDASTQPFTMEVSLRI